MDAKLMCMLGLGLLVCSGLSDAAVSYVRWGRSTCPTGIHKLYNGYMVGRHFNGNGNGGNKLCVADKPQYVRGQPGHQDWAGGLWGIEFEKTQAFDGLFLKDNLPNGQLTNQDLVCVVCYVADSTDLLMIPGRQDCYNTGYDLQYKGFLVAHANYAGRQPEEYVCLDEAPEGRIGGEGNDDQGVVYPIELFCGSLPCNPFVDGMEATCAVCTY